MNKQMYCLILLFIGTLSIKAQPDENFRTISISYNESIPESSLELNLENYDWNVLLNDKKLTSGTGASLLQYVFISPGEYKLILNKKHFNNLSSCNHNDDVYTFNINVIKNKIVFDFDKIKFSKKITGNVDCSDITIFIPVEIFADYEVEISENIISYGINTNIIGTLKSSQKKLTSGKHILEYQLKGKAQSGTFIGFDFKDLNNHTLSYNLPYQIN
jgi:hypothetical protein